MNTRLSAWVVLALLMGGCRSAPIYNVDAASVVVTSGKQVSPETVGGAILRAGARLGWQMAEVRPGLIDARITLRGHSAGADVKYDAKTYSISYRESSNLNAAGENVHKNYNGWVTNLDREIRAELLKV
jgi:hypothetical protein